MNTDLAAAPGQEMGGEDIGLLTSLEQEYFNNLVEMQMCMHLYLTDPRYILLIIFSDCL